MAAVFAKPGAFRLMSNCSCSLTRTFAASTEHSKHFTPSQIDHFNSHGFVRSGENFLSTHERQDVIQWVKEMHAWPETKGKWMKYFEQNDSNRVLCRVENFLPYHQEARELVRGKITDAISELMGEEAILYKEKVNFKLPKAKGFPPHQDAPAYITFGMDYHVTCMIAADPANRDNGCLEVVPWSRSQGVLPHPGGSIPDDLVSEWNRNGSWIPLLCQAGDVVFFNSLIPHRSQDNRSTTQSRSIYYLTFNPLRDGDRRDGYYEDKRLRFPPDIEKEPGRDYSEGAAIYNVSTPIRVRV